VRYIRRRVAILFGGPKMGEKSDPVETPIRGDKKPSKEGFFEPSLRD